MNDLSKAISNWRTSTLGAGAGATFYSGAVGLKFPSTREEWLGLAFSLIITLFGLLAKDGAVGSPAK